MKLVNLKLSNLIPYENNPRIHGNAVNAVAESIRQCTYIAPIIIDENHVILAGHTRYKALQMLDIEEVPCLICEGLTEEQKKKYRYLDNKTGEKATWNLIKLEVELEGIDLENFSFFGMTDNLSFDSDEPTQPPEISGSKEFDTEDFDDEQFKYQCPACGFRFN